MLNAFAESSSWPAKNDPHGISISQMMREIYVLHTGILKNPLQIYIFFLPALQRQDLYILFCCSLHCLSGCQK